MKKYGDFTLQQTKFGWTILGPVIRNSTEVKPSPTCLLSIQDIDERLKLFWETEQPPEPASPKSEEQKRCEQHFEETYQRLPSGQFQVRLPFREPKATLVSNYRRALGYLKRVERSSTPETRTLYRSFMQEYADLKHMSVANESETQRYFIPYQAVLRESSTTTKFRVVFNASAKTPSGKSLNDILMIGPSIQPELFSILLNFRKYAYVFTADVAKMYRCVLVHPDDRPMQSILWRETDDSEPKAYELNTVTYGTAPASFLATKCLEKLAETTTDPVAQAAIRSCIYMDDLLTGANSVEEAVKLRTEIHRTLESAQFVLRKYQSNSTELLHSIPPELIETQLSKNIGGKESISVLGMEWIPKDDVFRIKLPKQLSESRKLTKRAILSESAKIFDPLGFLSPITVREKIFVQNLWREELSWDQLAPEHLVTEFYQLRSDYRLLEEFAVPRAFPDQSKATDIIGFCDASPKAYCAVVYVRSIHESQPASINLVCAKTRVAPLKEITIPKLELQAALLLAELLDHVRNQLKINSVYAFSDSQVALSWLAKPADSWKTFVANRVKRIENLVPFLQCWGYVPSSDNPADLATRGLSVKSFLDNPMWLQGPAFIKNSFIPKRIDTITTHFDEERRKPKPTCNLITTDVNYRIDCINRISNFNRLVRSFSYLNRFVHCIKSKRHDSVKSTLPASLTATELNSSEVIIIKLTQMYYYAHDYTRLLQSQKIRKRSVLRSINPFLDENGIIRAATRLANANVSYDRKYPVVLPSKSHFLQLLIRHLHDKYYHATRTFITTQIRLRFYVTGGLTNVAKFVLRQCVTCLRFSSESHRQLMADLPKERLTIARPFSVIGVDFAGPLWCKPMAKRSKIRFKAYAAVFICFASRAIHLEVVPSLTTEDFLNSFKRFIARRGLPNSVFSDNGTNFKGSSHHIDFQNAAIQELAANERISWKFNPPYAPHRGGLWEAGVKSMKRHLLRATADQVYNFDELSTLLAQIEAILNSRPLAYRKSETADYEIITPGHLLIGDHLLSIPETEDSPIAMTTRYSEIRRRISSFWTGWSKDYLNQLQAREKWQTPAEPLKPGDVVIIRDKSSRPNVWPLGEVVKTYPDQTGAVRTAVIRTLKGDATRDTSGLIRITEAGGGMLEQKTATTVDDSSTT